MLILKNKCENLSKKFLLVCLLLFIYLPMASLAQQKEIVAYFPDWMAGEDTFYTPYYVKDIVEAGSAEKLTVLNYAFIVPGPDSSGNILPQFTHAYNDYQQPYTAEMSVDGVADDSVKQSLRGHFNQLKKLKKNYPNLKMLVSIGGWGGSKYFSDAALTQETREIFVDACIDIFIKGNLPIENNAGGRGVAKEIFDGFDIDWEFPYYGGPEGIHHNKNDIDNFTKLLALFRVKLDSINPKYLLTAAVPAREDDYKYFNFSDDQQYLDWYNLMTYDYHGSWQPLTNHATNLLTSPKDIISETNSESYDKSVKLLKDVYGVSKNKIVPGGAFYGKGWGNVYSANNGLYQPGGPIENWMDTNFNIKVFYTEQSPSHGYEYYWDKYAMAPLLYNKKKKIFFSIDDIKSIALKSRYVDTYDLRGFMFWEISGDDSNGTLVSTIYDRNMPDIKLNKINKNGLVNITVVSPKESDWINDGSNIIIEAESTDQNIIKVEFFGDNKSLGYTTFKPFNWVWFNVPQGEHEIKVSAVNANGDMTISDPVRIFIHKK